MAIEKDIEIKGDDIITKLSENYKSVKIGFVKVSDSYKILDASLDKSSTT